MEAKSEDLLSELTNHKLAHFASNIAALGELQHRLILLHFEFGIASRTKSLEVFESQTQGLDFMTMASQSTSLSFPAFSCKTCRQI